MTMGQQNTIEASKTGATAQQLTLGTLPAIHQDAVSSCLDEKGRMVAFSRWDARRRPQKGEREHRRPCLSRFRVIVESANTLFFNKNEPRFRWAPWRELRSGRLPLL